MEWDKLVILFTSPLMLALLGYIVKMLGNHMRAMHLMRIDIIAMDHALSLESQNGYKDVRDNKKDQLMKDYEFKNKV